ncbi:MAG: molybdate ABC transporter substrate-binding protein [Myxococcota bacterium]
MRGVNLPFLLAMLFLAGCAREESAHKELVIAAAASLRPVMPLLAERFRQKQPGEEVLVTYGASGDLRRQVELGAPIDAVFFAAAEPVDRLDQAGLLDASTRRVVATNELVLIGPKEAPPVTFAELSTLGKEAKLAIGEPAAVPAGQYAREALRTLGSWDAVQPHLVFGGDVAGVLSYARRGEVRAAIVYRTEVAGFADVAIYDVAQTAWSPRPEVVAAVTRHGQRSFRAKAFLDFTSSAEGQKAFLAKGFGSP